jgi:hypothetical protein
MMTRARCLTSPPYFRTELSSFSVHPKEEIFHRIYGKSFVLIGAYCSRRQRNNVGNKRKRQELNQHQSLEKKREAGIKPGTSSLGSWHLGLDQNTSAKRKRALSRFRRFYICRPKNEILIVSCDHLVQPGFRDGI